MPLAGGRIRLLAAVADIGVKFDDITVVPFNELLDAPRGGSNHAGGPLWPDWDEQVQARHCRRGRPIDTRPSARPAVRTIMEPHAWGGPVVRQFGHQIADFSMRLLPTLRAIPDIRLVFASSPRFRMDSTAQAPRFFASLLAWIGLPPSQTVFANEPEEYRELHVFPQAEQLQGPGPTEEHLGELDTLAIRRLGSRRVNRGPVLVSRAQQRARFAGEGYVEQVAAAAGMTVVRPETLPLDEQLRLYRDAESLVFSEGSAIHGLQLLGHVEADIQVLVRRPGFRVGRHSLEPRTERLTYSEVSLGLVSLLTGSGRFANALGLSILDQSKLLKALASSGTQLARHWDPRGFEVAQYADIVSWLEWAARRGGLTRGSYDTILECLDQVDQPDLMGVAERILGTRPEADRNGREPAPPG